MMLVSCDGTVCCWNSFPPSPTVLLTIPKLHHVHSHLHGILMQNVKQRFPLALQRCSVLVCRSGKVEAELVDVSVNGKQQRGVSMKVAHSTAVTCLTVELTNSQQLLVSAGQDRDVKVWSLLDNQLLCMLAGHKCHVCVCICLSRVCPYVCMSVCVHVIIIIIIVIMLFIVCS